MYLLAERLAMTSGDTPSELKNTIDSQSGRFEFLKQCLTLGSAGLAGVAAVFSDPEKIPSGSGARFLVCLIGISLISTVGFALFGISSYANLLRLKTRQVTQEDVDKGYTPDNLEKNITGQAKGVMFSLFIACGLLFGFAAKQVIWQNTADIEDAVTSALKFVKTNIPENGLGARFVKLQSLSNSYIIVFQLPNNGKYVAVTVLKKDGSVSAVESDASTSVFIGIPDKR